MTIGTHSIFVDDEDKSEAQPVSNDVADNSPDPTRETSEVVQEEAPQPIQDTLE